jgi:hypothetical protein
LPLSDSELPESVSMYGSPEKAHPQRFPQLRRLRVAALGKLLDVVVEAVHGACELAVRLARVLPRLQPFPQGGQLLGDDARVSLQLTRGLQRADAGANLRRQPEAREQGEAHHHGEGRTHAGRDQPTIAICACDFHVGFSLTAW